MYYKIKRNIIELSMIYYGKRKGRPKTCMKTKEIHFFMGGGAGPTYTLQIFDLDLRLANLGSHTEE